MLTKGNNLLHQSMWGLLCRTVTRLLPFPPPTTRLGRRRLVVATVVVIIALVVLGTVLNSFLPLLVLAPVVMLLVLALGVSVDGITDRPTSLLDERERALRDRAVGRPWEYGVAVGVLLGLLVARTSDNGGPGATSLLLAATLVAFLIPGLSIAWTMPDAVDDE